MPTAPIDRIRDAIKNSVDGKCTVDVIDLGLLVDLHAHIEDTIMYERQWQAAQDVQRVSYQDWSLEQKLRSFANVGDKHAATSRAYLQVIYTMESLNTESDIK